MRRKDREVTDSVKIQKVVDDCTCCRIGFCDEGKVYIVPMNFGYEKEGDKYTLYFHSAHEGRKVNLIKTSPNVGFEMDTNYRLNEAKAACGHSASFQSIIGNGKVEIVEDAKEKIHGLELIMKHNTGKTEWGFTERMVSIVTVFKLEVEEMSCKDHE